MTEANDIIQALAKQRNDHADDAAGLFADLMASNRKLKELQDELNSIRCPECKRFKDQGHYDDCPIGLSGNS